MSGSGKPISRPTSAGDILRALTGAATVALGALLVGQGTSQLAALPNGGAGQLLVAGVSAPGWSGSSLTWASSQLAGSGGSAPVPQASTAWALSGGVGRFGTQIVVDGTAAGSITTAGGVTAPSGLYVNGTSGAIKSFCQIQRGGVTAWFMSVRDATDDLRFRAYDDAGVAIDYPLTIARAAGGAITLTRPLTATSIAMAGALSGVTTIDASSTITCTVNVDSFPVFYSAVNNSTGANAGSGFSFSTGDSSGYVGCFSGSYATATLADRVILGANSAASNGAGVYIPTAGQTFNIIGGGGAVTASFPTAGGLVVGASALLASERMLISGGGALPSVGATQVAVSNGGIACGAGITAGASSAVSATSTSGLSLSVRNLSNGTGAFARLQIQADVAAAFNLDQFSSTYTGTAWGITLANYAVFSGSSSTSNGLIIGHTATKPLIFAIGTAEVARFVPGGLTLSSTNNLICTNTADGSDNARVIIAAGGTADPVRGASFQMYGNEYATYGGRMYFDTGEAGSMYFRYGASSTTALQVSSAGVVSVPLTADGAFAVSCKIAAKVAVPDSFADLAAVRSYLASILT